MNKKPIPYIFYQAVGIIALICFFGAALCVIGGKFMSGTFIVIFIISIITILLLNAIDEDNGFGGDDCMM